MGIKLKNVSECVTLEVNGEERALPGVTWFNGEDDDVVALVQALPPSIGDAIRVGQSIIPLVNSQYVISSGSAHPTLEVRVLGNDIVVREKDTGIALASLGSASPALRVVEAIVADFVTFRDTEAPHPGADYAVGRFMPSTLGYPKVWTGDGWVDLTSAAADQRQFDEETIRLIRQLNYLIDSVTQTCVGGERGYDAYMDKGVIRLRPSGTYQLYQTVDQVVCATVAQSLIYPLLVSLND